MCAGTMGVEEERQSEVTATLLNVRSRAQTQWAKYKVLEELQMQRSRTKHKVPEELIGSGSEVHEGEELEAKDDAVEEVGDDEGADDGEHGHQGDEHGPGVDAHDQEHDGNGNGRI